MEERHKEPETNTPEDKLDDVFSMDGYDKPVRNARIVLFIIAALQLVGILTVHDVRPEARLITIGIYVLFAVVFALLGLWTKKKPFTAIVTGLIIYSILILIGAIFEPSSILKGWLAKVVVYVLLIGAVSNAREVQQWKESQSK